MNKSVDHAEIWLSACSGFLCATSFPAFAEQETPAVLRVDVTGSNIKRTDVETALPVQVITRAEIERSGATTSVELLGQVSANLIGASDGTSIASNTPGLASANLRGLGSGSTLVLINGRRVANYAFDGGAVDLNSIPLAAVLRVEILKDGASAIYGADAMAGVVNFILRKDFAGVQLTANTGVTEHRGGNHQQAALLAGYGDLSTDHFNVFVTVDWQKDQAVHAIDRPFSRTAYIPDEGINKLSTQTFPANIRVGGALLNPTRADGCAPPVSLPRSPTSPTCAFDYASVIDILPPVERLGVFASGTWQVNAHHQLFAQYIYSNNKLTLRTSPTPASQQTTFNGDPVTYPAGGPFYPTAFAAANGITGDLNLFYRTVPLGPRTDEVITEAHVLIAGTEGVFAGWDYRAALIYSGNNQKDTLHSGYVSEERLRTVMATGLVNPFGPSGPDGDALLASTQTNGEHRAKGSTSSIEAKVSRDIYDLPAGHVALAMGAEARREKFDDTFGPEFNTGDILGGAGDQNSKTASRSVEALFAELNVPIVRNVEAQLALRYDHYSDFGNTVNPKVAVRWQPMRSILFRSSWGTGFRAPTLYDLYTPLSHGFTGPTLSDPLRCPVTGLPTDCDLNFRLQTGGNPGLAPEKSRQFNAGVVWEALAGLSLGADYWKIDKTGSIGQLASDTIIDNADRFGATNIIRGPVDPAYPKLPGPIQYILAWQQNLGKLRTSGVDVDLTWRGLSSAFGRLGFSLNGTYIIDWRQQQDGIHEVTGVGRNSGQAAFGAVPRWRHYAALDWTLGPWGATLAQNFTSGYTDANFDAAGNERKVAPNDIWNVQASYSGFRNTTLVLGVKNVFDRAPPFSNQQFFFQVGYNPQYSDPRGRMLYGSLTFAFK